MLSTVVYEPLIINALLAYCTPPNGKHIEHISGTYTDDTLHTYECWYVQILVDKTWKYFVVNTEDNRVSLEFFKDELPASRNFAMYQKRYKGEENGIRKKVRRDAISTVGKGTGDFGSSGQGSDSQDDWSGTGNLF
jgi:hypothetical protein